MDNETIVTMIRAGDTSLYGALWENLRPDAAFLCGRFCENHGEVLRRLSMEPEDLMQLAFVELYTAVRRYDGGRGVGFRTLYNTVLRWRLRTIIKQSAGQPFFSSLESLLERCAVGQITARERQALAETAEDPVARYLDAASEAETFREALSRFDPGTRELLERVCLGGERVSRVAREEGKDPASLYRARKQALGRGRPRTVRAGKRTENKGGANQG